MFFRLDIGSRARTASRLIGDIRNDILRALVKEKSAKGLTQQQLADKLGISRAELNSSLAGKRELTLRSTKRRNMLRCCNRSEIAADCMAEAFQRRPVRRRLLTGPVGWTQEQGQASPHGQSGPQGQPGQQGQVSLVVMGSPFLPLIVDRHCC